MKIQSIIRSGKIAIFIPPNYLKFYEFTYIYFLMSDPNPAFDPIHNNYSAEEISSALCSFLQQNILAPDVQVTPDTELALIGVDSFSLMEIILFIERRFGLILPPESLTPQNTSSVSNLSLCCVNSMAN